MFKGLGSLPAVSAEPLYAPPRHKIWFAILLYINCVALVVCGGVGFFFACINYKYLAHCFLGLYMIMFGIISLLADLRIGFAQRAFGFACSPKGMGMVLIFAGTLGLCFGIGKSLGLIIPFAGGIFSILVGFGSMFESSSVHTEVQDV